MINLIANILKRIREWFTLTLVSLKMKRSLQLDSYSCGIHVVKMILDYYKVFIRTSELKKWFTPYKDDGIDEKKMFNLLAKYKLRIYEIKNPPLSKIFGAIDKSYPVLACIDDEEHWIIIYGYSINGLFILDPALTSTFGVKWSFDTWKKRGGNWVAIVEGDLIKKRS